MASNVFQLAIERREMESLREREESVLGEEGRDTRA